jgi:hypothetical protein
MVGFEGCGFHSTWGAMGCTTKNSKRISLIKDWSGTRCSDLQEKEKKYDYGRVLKTITVKSINGF